jgi:very-short-patch-repair endonuclease
MNPDPNLAIALEALRICRADLGAAGINASAAARRLSGSPAERARELVSILVDALCLTEKICVCVEGDIHADIPDPRRN